MLTINLSPWEDAQRKGPVFAEWAAPVLMLDGTSYNLSELPDGATAVHPALGQVSRNGDDYECTVTLRYKHGAPEETTWPEPITVTEDGPIELPPYNSPEAEEPTDELAE